MTDATAFNTSGTMTIFGYLGVAPVGTGLWDPRGDLISVTIGGIAVPTTVPLPAPAILLLAGVGALVGVRRKRPA